MIMRLMRTLLALAVALVLAFAYGLPMGLPSLSAGMASDISPPGEAHVSLSLMGQEQSNMLNYLYADKDLVLKRGLDQGLTGNLLRI